LARIGRLALLRQFASQVVAPHAVFQEVIGQGSRPGEVEVNQGSWISRQPVRDAHRVALLQAELARGEAEAIVLAGEINADFIILDDARARQIAQRNGLRVIGLLGLLIRAKELGLIDAIKPLRDNMIKAGFYIGATVYRDVMAKAGES
jgi:predicted nucleic acid-binding protein